MKFAAHAGLVCGARSKILLFLKKKKEKDF